MGTSGLTTSGWKFGDFSTDPASGAQVQAETFGISRISASSQKLLGGTHFGTPHPMLEIAKFNFRFFAIFYSGHPGKTI
jgi:hypothetical protein